MKADVRWKMSYLYGSDISGRDKPVLLKYRERIERWSFCLPVSQTLALSHFRTEPAEQDAMPPPLGSNPLRGLFFLFGNIHLWYE